MNRGNLPRLLPAPVSFEESDGSVFQYSFHVHSPWWIVRHFVAFPPPASAWLSSNDYPPRICATQRPFLILATTKSLTLVAIRCLQDGAPWWVKGGIENVLGVDLTPEELVTVGYAHCFYIEVRNVAERNFHVYVAYRNGRMRRYGARGARFEVMVRDLFGPVDIGGPLPTEYGYPLRRLRD